MKHRITLSIALVLSIALLSLMSSDSTVKAERLRTYSADTGVVTLGPGQILRITVAPQAGRPTDSFSLNFVKIEYDPSTCNDDGVCIHTVTSRTTTDPVRLMPGESASIDITPTPNSSAVRSVVTVDSPDVQVNAFIIDIDTGAIVSHVKVFSGVDY